MKFIAVRKCLLNGHLCNEGNIIEFADKDIKPCPACDGNGCVKCRDTGRISPPHHFRPLDAVEKEKQEEETQAKSELEGVKDELNRIGKPFDKRLGLSKLKNLLIVAKKEV